MTSLRVLDVANNNFSEAIPSSLLYNLKSLEYIVFSGNAFEGSLSLASLANNSNLEVFHLLNNHNHLEVNTEEPTWFPSFQLKVFTLSNCVLNEDANVVIPSFLKEQHDLILLQLIHNGMNGNFPNWLLENNVYLVQFKLTGNNLSGTFHLPSNLNLDNMLKLDVSANIIEGENPSWIASILPNLICLNLSKNLLEGRIPYSMGNMNQLHTLDLSNNRFTGEIPEPLAKNCTSLVVLKLSSNNLQGNMLPRGSNLTSSRYLYLDNNCFIGDISSGILNSSLQVLDVSNNSLSGTLPHWIGDIEFLEMLKLSSNLFRGPLPLSFCNLHCLKLLVLSDNNLGPNISPCVNVTVMRFLHLTNDMLAGHLPEFLSRASLMVTLDLRHNALSGEVPAWIGSLWNLKFLLLQENRFEGSIPLDLCLLKNMSILDLSNNNLSGQIPSCLKDLAFGNNRVSTDTFDTFSDSQQIVLPYVYISKLSIFFSDYEDKGSMYAHRLENLSSMYTYGLEKVHFMTKSRLELYEGHILQLMSGIDLSQNNLTGFIPLESVESLDLSYNNLICQIPPQLTELYTLSNFRVAYKNLSSRTPDRKNQFGTLDDPRREAFLWSFAGSYVVAFLGMVLFLYLNSYYEYVLFELVSSARRDQVSHKLAGLDGARASQDWASCELIDLGRAQACLDPQSLELVVCAFGQLSMVEEEGGRRRKKKKEKGKENKRK
ncbi:hypothetical protein EUGRSUZ_F00060 [Eucalyptus grandis]|uniref:Uncharacterized protein n=2 Tax=Eucalyptus grandis TaxID=71139 RepID=A0ACC3KA69_EUCGR|nr:hypothetical protein EUGRSUZ_F00060 [Eucalyptus grandis]